MTRSTRFTCVLWEKRTEIENEIMKMYIDIEYGKEKRRKLHRFAPLRPQISAKMRPTCFAISKMKCSKSADNHCVIFMLNVDECLSEFRECFQKMENNMEICRIC